MQLTQVQTEQHNNRCDSDSDRQELTLSSHPLFSIDKRFRPCAHAVTLTWVIPAVETRTQFEMGVVKGTARLSPHPRGMADPIAGKTQHANDRQVHLRR